MRLFRLAGAVGAAALVAACNGGGSSGQAGAPGNDDGSQINGATTPARVAECQRASNVELDLPEAHPDAPPPAPATGADAYRYLREYTGLGLHRSGTPGGAKVKDWMAAELAAIGYDVEVEPFGFQRYVPEAYRITVGDENPCTFPLYHSGATPTEGIRAELFYAGTGTPAEMTGAEGKIVLVDVPVVLNFLAPTLETVRQAAADAGALAVVAAIQGPENWIVASNVEQGAGICGMPTLYVGKEDGDALQQLAGQEAEFVLDAGIEEDAETYNVIATMPGSSDDTLVIGTPMHGWFTTAGERGGGVGAFLSLARYLAERGPFAQNVVFLATGGHEVGKLGLIEYIEDNPDRLSDISAYVHLGASIAAKEYVEIGGEATETGLANLRTLYVSENPVLQPIAQAAMRGNGVATLSTSPPAAFNPGEQQFMYAAGVPIASISASHFYFHTPRDLADNVTPALLDPVVKGFRDIVDQLLMLDPELVRSANAAAEALAGDATQAGTCTVPPQQ